MAELEDEACILNESIALLACFSNASWEKSYKRRNRNTRNQRYSSYPNRQKRNSVTYSHYYASGDSEPNYSKKYLEKLPNTLKKII